MQAVTIVQITPLELEKLLKNAIKEVLDEKENNEIKQQTSEFLTRKEAAKLLKVSFPTLLNWTNSGKLIGYKISKSVRYKRSELENFFLQIKNK